MPYVLNGITGDDDDNNVAFSVYTNWPLHSTHCQAYYLNKHIIKSGTSVLWNAHYSCDRPKIIKLFQLNQEIMHITTSQHVDDWLQSRGCVCVCVCVCVERERETVFMPLSSVYISA